MNSRQILDHEFLDMRCRILDVASSLDRIQRADGSVSDDPRMKKISDALTIALSSDDCRAERIQLLFSKEYDEDWKQRFDSSK